MSASSTVGATVTAATIATTAAADPTPLPDRRSSGVLAVGVDARALRTTLT